MDCCKPGSEHRFWLGPEFQHDPAFWRNFVTDAEQALWVAGIASHGGTAEGDVPLGRYASLRNEAFIQGREMREDGRTGPPTFIYPPNEAGWNAAGHPTPIHVPLHSRFQAAAARAFCLGALRCPLRRPRIA